MLIDASGNIKGNVAGEGGWRSGALAEAEPVEETHAGDVAYLDEEVEDGEEADEEWQPLRLSASGGGSGRLPRILSQQEFSPASDDEDDEPPASLGAPLSPRHQQWAPLAHPHRGTRRRHPRRGGIQVWVMRRAAPPAPPEERQRTAWARAGPARPVAPLRECKERRSLARALYYKQSDRLRVAWSLYYVVVSRIVGRSRSVVSRCRATAVRLRRACARSTQAALSRAQRSARHQSKRRDTAHSPVAMHSSG